jgi:hypothetical protein
MRRLRPWSSARAALGGATLALVALSACAIATKHPPELNDCLDPAAPCAHIPFLYGTAGGGSPVDASSGDTGAIDTGSVVDSGNPVDAGADGG